MCFLKENLSSFSGTLGKKGGTEKLGGRGRFPKIREGLEVSGTPFLEDLGPCPLETSS